MSISWTGAARPELWLIGIDAGYDYALEVSGRPTLDGNRIEATIPAGVWATAYVGLPTGVTLLEPLAYEISVHPN